MASSPVRVIRNAVWGRVQTQVPMRPPPAVAPPESEVLKPPKTPGSRSTTISPSRIGSKVKSGWLAGPENAVSRDSPDQTDFPGYSSLWDTANYNLAFQGRQMRPDSLGFPAFMGQPPCCQAQNRKNACLRPSLPLSKLFCPGRPHNSNQSRRS